MRSLSGTSIATPHVAGVAALWAEKVKQDATELSDYEAALEALGYEAVDVDDGRLFTVQSRGEAF